MGFWRKKTPHRDRRQGESATRDEVRPLLPGRDTGSQVPVTVPDAQDIHIVFCCKPGSHHEGVSIEAIPLKWRIRGSSTAAKVSQWQDMKITSFREEAQGLLQTEIRKALNSANTNREATFHRVLGRITQGEFRITGTWFRLSADDKWVKQQNLCVSTFYGQSSRASLDSQRSGLSHRSTIT